jgi:hypothetical protein
MLKQIVPNSDTAIVDVPGSTSHANVCVAAVSVPASASAAHAGDSASAAASIPPPVTGRRRSVSSASGMIRMRTHPSSGVSSMTLSVPDAHTDDTRRLAVFRTDGPECLCDLIPIAPPPQVLDFVKFLHSEVCKTNTFFVKQYQDFLEQLQTLRTQLDMLQQKADRNPDQLSTWNSRKEKYRHACKELYRGFHFLLNYQVLNWTACIKILKKHDKMDPHWKEASLAFLPVIQPLEFASSPDVKDHLITELEELFTLHFREHGKKAIDELRDKVEQKPMAATCFMGFCVGLSVALLVLLGFVVHSDTGQQFVVPRLLAVFPLFRFVALIALQMWLWGVVTLTCRRYHINYMFLMDMDTKNSVAYQHVLAMAAVVTLLLMTTITSFSVLLFFEVRVLSGGHGVLHALWSLLYVCVCVLSCGSLCMSGMC